MAETENPEWREDPNFMVVPGVFTAAECERIIGLSSDIEGVEDNLQGRKGTVRSSKIFWTRREPERTQWMYDRVADAVTTWNDASFRFDIRGCPEQFQLTCYEVGQMYDWHQDLGRGPTSRRKISITTLLSNPTSFDGGNLEFFVSDVFRPAPKLAPGDAVLFPSFMKHRVTPVTRGARWSLVAWFTGPPLR